MQSPITSHHWTDEKGRPAGGVTEGRGFTISWQNGPLMADGVRREPNGAFVEDVIKAAHDRIDFYQVGSDGRFACQENATALIHLELALEALDSRTRAREQQGVEGTHETHVSAYQAPEPEDMVE